MAGLAPLRVPTPQKLRDSLLGKSLAVECYAIGDCAVIVTRVDVSDARDEGVDYRWSLQIGHPARMPIWDELKAARGLLPDDLHFAMPFPHRGYWNTGRFTFFLWQVQDGNLTDQWEYDFLQERPPPVVD